MKPDQNNSPFGEIIYSYTRAQAVADGVQVEVTKTAQEAGIRPRASFGIVLHNTAAFGVNFPSFIIQSNNAFNPSANSAPLIGFSQQLSLRFGPAAVRTSASRFGKMPDNTAIG